MQINTSAACRLLMEQDNIVILTHHKPDGDTLGAGFALLYALELLGKNARVECPEEFPERYRFLTGNYIPKDFEPAYIVAVDVASPQLLGGLWERYQGRIGLCIDHHKSNDLPAGHTLLDAASPATCQMMYKLILGLGLTVNVDIANALFTGLSTDTGCFKYDNVTPTTHRVAADLIEAGANHATINKIMFDTKSRGRMEVERLMLENLEYYFNGQCAMIVIFPGTPAKYGVSEDELDGISSMPRRIEGVKAGITIREKEDGSSRVSLRTGDGLDASRICAKLGGGGHKNAAGCTLHGSRAAVKAEILAQVEAELKELGMLE